MLRECTALFSAGVKHSCGNKSLIQPATVAAIVLQKSSPCIYPLSDVVPTTNSFFHAIEEISKTSLRYQIVMRLFRMTSNAEPIQTLIDLTMTNCQ